MIHTVHISTNRRVTNRLKSEAVVNCNQSKNETNKQTNQNRLQTSVLYSHREILFSHFSKNKIFECNFSHKQ